jgi:two-component system chemotaxis sensor kinase CheA
MQRLRFVDIKSLLASYPKIVQHTATRLQKHIAEFSIEGDTVLVDPDYFYSFSKALIHVFRNAVDHGIESPEQREELGKSELGKVYCHVKREQHAVILTISDDGAGINITQLKQSCLALGRYTQQQLDSFSEQQCLMLIFEQELSTATQVTLISGQGVGLAVVLEELQKIHGSVLVTSSLEQGTCFTFTLPITD